MLTAIAVPVFTTQLEKSREATDMSNIRSAYAEVIAAGLVDNRSKTATVVQRQQQNGWQTVAAEGIAGIPLSKLAASNGHSTVITFHPAAGSASAYVSISGNVASTGYTVS